MAIQDRIKKISIIEKIESRIVYDLADRVAKMHDINITNRLRNLLSERFCCLLNTSNLVNNLFSDVRKIMNHISKPVLIRQ